MSLYLKNARYLDWKTLNFKSVNLKIDEGPNSGIHFIQDCPSHAYDCRGNIVTKAFVCGHHHTYSALALGMPPPKNNPRNFFENLKYIWWALDKNLDSDMVRACALVTAMNCARNGITFVVDHHSSPFSIPNSLRVIAQTFKQIGIDYLLCYELSDRDGAQCVQKGLLETEEYLKENQGLVGLHASFTVGNELVQEAVNIAREYNSGIHMHVAEDNIDQQHCLENYGSRVLERMEKHGVLKFKKTILAHCIHIDENERSLLSDSNAWIVVNTESNLKNGVGLFTAGEDLENKVMLGTDGMHSDMIRSAQWNYFTHKAESNVEFDTVYKRLRRVHYYLQQNEFKGDGENNLIILNYNPATPVTSENWLGHFLYNLSSCHIHGVISNGRFIVKDNKILSVDADEVLEFAKVQAKRLWSKL